VVVVAQRPALARRHRKLKGNQQILTEPPLV
jgi:hypothetical protein